jgi:site-specific recombinase XerD
MDEAGTISRRNHSSEVGNVGLFPSLILREGEGAARAYLNFFTASIENDNTRSAYYRAVTQFLSWCEARSVTLKQVEPWMVATYIKAHPGSPATVKLHLAALRRLFDHLYVERVMDANPASPVRGPKYSVTQGKTPVMTGADAYYLLESIETDSIKGLRDRALIGVMLYSFARVSATLGMRAKDYFQSGRSEMSLRLQEKGGKAHVVVAHHVVQEYLDAYVLAGGIEGAGETPLFRSVSRSKTLSGRSLNRTNALKMIKARAKAAGLPENLSPHSLRGTGITNYLENGGKLEVAQQIAAHSDPRTTKLYDRRSDKVQRSEIERIRFEPGMGLE